MLGEGAMETTEENSVDNEVIMSEEDVLREAVKLRSEEAGVEGAKNTQVLYFDEDYGSNDIRLIELSPELLKILKEEKSFVLRGDAGEEAVLCTSDKTYSVRECTTSNSLLLTPDLSTDTDTVSDVISTRRVTSTNFVYYELKLCRAKLDKMREILNSSAYSGEESEVSEKGNKVTMEDLLGNIQASEEELKSGLDELGAIELNGYWRVIDHEYKTSAVSRILSLLEEMSWSWEKVPLIESCHTLAQLQPRFVTELCLRLYGNQDSETEDEVFIKLCEDKICRFYGQYILSSSAGKFNLKEFLEVWQDSLPDGMTADLTHLRGVALVNKSSKPHTISYLSVTDLPVQPARRFAFLFTRQEKWSHNDIIPYLEDLIGPGQTVNALLLKHCRSTTDPATKQKIYNSKSRS